MTNEKLAETILLQLEIFVLVQFIDERCERNDADAIRLLTDLHLQRHPDLRWEDLLPLVRLNTSFAMLTLPICFVSRFDDEELYEFGFRVRPEHDLLYRDKGRVTAATSSKVLRTFRNAIAHLPDFAAGTGTCLPNVTFDEGIARLSSRDTELVFRSEEGYVQFLRDLIPAIRSGVRNRLL